MILFVCMAWGARVRAGEEVEGGEKNPHKIVINFIYTKTVLICVLGQ